MAFCYQGTVGIVLGTTFVFSTEGRTWTARTVGQHILPALVADETGSRKEEHFLLAGKKRSVESTLHLDRHALSLLDPPFGILILKLLVQVAPASFCEYLVNCVTQFFVQRPVGFLVLLSAVGDHLATTASFQGALDSCSATSETLVWVEVRHDEWYQLHLGGF